MRMRVYGKGKIEGQTYEEISKELEISHATIRSESVLKFEQCFHRLKTGICQVNRHQYRQENGHFQDVVVRKVFHKDAFVYNLFYKSIKVVPQI